MKKLFIITTLILGIVQVLGQSKAEYIRMGKAKMGVQEYQEALNHFQSAIDMDASHGEAYYWRGRMKILLGDMERASEDFRKAVQLDSTLMEAHQTVKKRKQSSSISTLQSIIKTEKND